LSHISPKPRSIYFYMFRIYYEIREAREASGYVGASDWGGGVSGWASSNLSLSIVAFISCCCYY
jgi:hypothetical protein